MSVRYKFQSILIAAALTGCAVQRSPSHMQTDLGESGNRRLIEIFAQYTAKDPQLGCAGTSGSKRVLITGFGLFSGADYNISGVVVQSMANSEFWPRRLNNALVSSGTLVGSDFGGRATNRVIAIGDSSYEVCFLTLDVQWDLAAAIIVHEMSRFKPNFVIMMGRGGDNDLVTLEGGAINRATKITGYDAAGRPLDENNVPIRNGALVLPDKQDVGGKADTIAMTWDNKKLAEFAAPKLRDVGYKVEFQEAARPANDYICNNVSYVSLYAAKGDAVRLAGEQLILQIEGGLRETKMGFLHLPVNASKSERSVTAMANAISEMIANY